MFDVSGVPVPGRPPGHQDGCGAWPAAAGQCSNQSVHGLPTPRAGNEYDDLHAHGADRYAPTDLRAFAAKVDLITASEYEDDLRACGAGHYVPTAPTDLRAFAAQLDLITASEYEDALRACANMDDLRTCVAMMDPFISRMDDADKARDSELLCVQADMNEALELEAQERRRALDEELELWLARDHIAFEAASRIQAVHSLVAQERPCAQDKDNAQYLEQENELLFVQVVHSLAAQERPCAQEKDSAQYLEQENDLLCVQENDGLCIQVGVFCVREMDMTVAAKIFAVAHQDHYISKSIAADAPTGSTLNEPESRAFTTDPRLHASRAKVKVGPLARIRIDDEVYT